MLKEIEAMKDDGWTVVCESPYELEHEDGGTATGYGAMLIRESYRDTLEVRIYRRALNGAMFEMVIYDDVKSHLPQHIIKGGKEI